MSELLLNQFEQDRALVALRYKNLNIRKLFGKSVFIAGGGELAFSLVSSLRMVNLKKQAGIAVFLLVEDIVLIEAFGHSLEVHSKSNSYQLTERLYKVLDMLDPNQFLRISNSVVIARNKVKSISPTLSMKFILTMINGKKVDVTRSYYYIFKEYFGI